MLAKLLHKGISDFNIQHPGSCFTESQAGLSLSGMELWTAMGGLSFCKIIMQLFLLKMYMCYWEAI